MLVLASLFKRNACVLFIASVILAPRCKQPYIVVRSTCSTHELIKRIKGTFGSAPRAAPTCRVRLVPSLHPSGQAPSGQTPSMQSVVVWLCGHPESS
jgi:hypothetical protein